MEYRWVLRRDTKAVFLAAIDRGGDGSLSFRPITLLTPRYDLEAEKFLLGPRVQEPLPGSEEWVEVA